MPGNGLGLSHYRRLPIKMLGNYRYGVFSKYQFIDGRKFFFSDVKKTITSYNGIIRHYAA